MLARDEPESLSGGNNGTSSTYEISRAGCHGNDAGGVGSTGPFRVEPGPAAGACGIVHRDERWHPAVLSRLGQRKPRCVLSSLGAERRYLGISTERTDRAGIALHHL